MRAVKQKVWNEAENRERDWGETLKIRACEARALRARKTLTPRFTDFFTDFEKKPTVLQSTLELSIDNNVRLEQLVGEKLLGVVIDPKLSWDLHIDFLIKKLTSRLCS